MAIYGRDSQIDHSNAFGREHLCQHGKGDDNILFMGETPGFVQEKVLIEANTDSIVIQHEAERDESSDLPHQHLQPGVV